MGNCIRKESSAQWGGEDWGSFTSNDKTRNRPSSCPVENSIDTLAEERSSLSGERVMPSGTEMKIKISKKQLEQLLKKADVQEISVEQVLAQLATAAVGDPAEAHQRPWSPALQTIPE